MCMYFYDLFLTYDLSLVKCCKLQAPSGVSVVLQQFTWDLANINGRKSCLMPLKQCEIVLYKIQTMRTKLLMWCKVFDASADIRIHVY